MVRSYDQLGMTDLRDDARRVLTKNFPTSGYLRVDGSVGDYSARASGGKPWWQFW